MYGVVLCGGQSSRMGKDKGLLTAAAQTWAQRAADMLFSLSIPVVLAVNESQYNDYAKLFPGQLVQDDASVGVKGPLQGILSVHAKLPTEDLFVLACDMPLITQPLLAMLQQLAASGKADAYLYTINGEYEPLCAIYTAPALQRILQLYQQETLQQYSMRQVLKNIYTSTLAVPPEDTRYFANLNYPDDLSSL